MGKITVLDCTLRDGGYINDWNFGEKAIKGFLQKIVLTGIEVCEVGFIKPCEFSKDRSFFPDTDCIKDVIKPKDKKMLYVGMVDLSAPVDLDKISPRDDDSLDGIRVIFKKNKLEEGYKYAEEIKKKGYITYVQFVGTDNYSDEEFIEAIHKFNKLKPDTVSIVDSFGLIERKQLLRLVYLADNNLDPGITLGYHAHNNLQQAMGNAQAIVELNLKRNVCIDACVFGMGRGAGNLNLELFARYLNENYDTQYRIEPMLEIMDEYLNDIYRDMFWGYSVPYYLSASNHCHPNYAIYLQKKGTLTVKMFNELMKSIPDDQKPNFSKENAEKYYAEYMNEYIDDKETLEELEKIFIDKNILVLAPGPSLKEKKEEILDYIHKNNPLVIAANFDSEEFPIDYIFSSNMKRFGKIEKETSRKTIITSNMKEAQKYDYMVNFLSVASKYLDILDNAGVNVLRLLMDLGVKEVSIAGMDGYKAKVDVNYFDQRYEYDYSREAELRNELIKKEIEDISSTMNCVFLTESEYSI